MLQRDSSNRDGDGRICWLVFIRVTIKRNRKRDEEWNRGKGGSATGCIVGGNVKNVSCKHEVRQWDTCNEMAFPKFEGIWWVCEMSHSRI